MSKSSTVVVTGRNSMRVPNLASLDRVLEILRTRPVSGMDATVPSGSVRITTAPVMGPHDDCCDCGCEGCGDGDLQDD